MANPISDEDTERIAGRLHQFAESRTNLLFVFVCRGAPVAALGSAAATACARSAWLPKAILAKGACRCGEAGEVCGAAGPWASGSRRCIWRRADVAGRSQFAGNEFISGLSVAEVRKVESSFDEGWPERFVDVPDAPANPCAERLDVSNHPPRSHSTCSSPKLPKNHRRSIGHPRSSSTSGKRG